MGFANNLVIIRKYFEAANILVTMIVTLFQEKQKLGLPYFEEQKRGHIILPMSTSIHG